MNATPAAPPRAPVALFAPSPTSSVRPEAPPLPPARRTPLAVWKAFALAGTWVGLKLRPLFGLINPRPGDGVC
ncbi:hypothetical protein [Streptomyces pactum]|uniref:hypothetical protein n=1 Tax=Streptomyces pactum TaxID=68249 RepID=UPI0006E15149|nr:hypothetical protein [Streptomyces pactum]